MKIVLNFVFFILFIDLNASAADESIKVDVVGVLASGIVAVGGESTGTTITAKGVTWELELGDLRQRASALDGKSVRVRGELERRTGVEINQRWIVKVSDLDARGAQEKATEKPEAPFEAEAVRGGGRVELSNNAETHEIEVFCKRGIGGANIVRRADRWPDNITVRLHLKGLESFKARSGEREFEWSVTSDNEKRTRMTLREGGKEKTIEKGDRHHTQVRTMGESHIVTLPAKLFEGNPQEITLNWIDFYR